MNAKRDIPKDELCAAIQTSLTEGLRRTSGCFDGLLGTLDGKGPKLINDLLDDLRDYLLERVDESRARMLLREYVPEPGFRWIPTVTDDIGLVLTLMITIANAASCEPDKRDRLLLGERDAKRQAGTRKPRRPKVDAWIDKQLNRDPGAKSPALWTAAPGWLKDQIQSDRFAKRVTKARKSRKNRVASK